MFGKKKNKEKIKRSLPSKILRIVGKSLSVVILIILLAAFIIPVVFKDEIVEAVKDEVENTVDAKVNITGDNFSLSLFSNFPDVTVQIENFSVIGVKQFEGDTLVSFQSFEVGLDLWSVMFGDKFEVNGIYLDKPFIQAKVLRNGKANWDIYIAEEDTTTEEEVTDTTATTFSLAIKEWRITDGTIIYDDLPSGMYAELKGFNHSGSGDFNETAFDLLTTTVIEEISYNERGGMSIEKYNLDMKMDLGISDNYGKYSFKENSIKLNEFEFEFDGFVALGETDIETDITFGTEKTEFKNLISLIPALYLTEFESLKTEGKFAFNGAAKGIYNETTIPAFNLNLEVEDGYFKYPDLPSDVSKVNIDLNVENKDGVIDNTIIDLKEFAMNLGKHPISAKAKIAGLTNMDVDAQANVIFDLADVNSFYPLEGITLKGLFNLTGMAKGLVNIEEEKYPVVAANFGLTNGFVKMAGVPTLEKMTVKANTGLDGLNLSSGHFTLSKFNMTLDGEQLNATASVKDFEAINFKAGGNGVLDLTKLMTLYPIDGMTLKGRILINNFSTEGNMAAIDEERYGDIPTSGDVNIENFEYYDDYYLPQGFKITNGNCTLTPKAIKMSNVNGFLGKSDFYTEGTIGNYMGYLFSETDTIINGTMVFNSKVFDIDEWMYEEEVPAGTTTSSVTIEEESYEVVPIPQNINFVMKSKIDKIKYENYDITDLVGTIKIYDGKCEFVKGTQLNMFGGQFTMDGIYSTQDMAHPSYDFNMGIKDMQIRKAYETFTTVQKFVPAAEKITGSFNTDFHFSGEHDNEYMPVYSTLSAIGDIFVKDATIKDMQVMSVIEKATKLKKFDEVKVENTLIKAEIEDGKLKIKPFDAKAGGINMKIGGTNGLDGKMDYNVGMDIPTDQMGALLDKLPANFNKDQVHLDLNVYDDMSKPKVKIVGGDVDAKEMAKEAAKEKITEKVDEAKAEVKEKVTEVKDDACEKAQKEADNIKAEAKITADKIREEGPILGEKARKEGYAAAKKVEDEASGPVAKAVAKKTADGMRKEADKKKQSLIDEANKKADGVESTAQKNADDLLKDCQ